MKSRGRILIANALVSVLLGFSLFGCSKVPLREQHASFDFTSAHWFENEQTEYVFFSVAGLRASQAKTNWPSSFEISTGTDQLQGLQPTRDGFYQLDLAKGVHQHQLKECGANRLCGSFSFHADHPTASLSLRFRYLAGSPMSEVTSLVTSEHPNTGGADAQSALVYGVFNSLNSRVQVRVHDNFGTPNADEIAQYGMTRSFHADSFAMADLTELNEKDLATQTGSQFLYPASICPSEARELNAKSLDDVGSIQFSGTEAWSGYVFDASDPRADACFRVRVLDREGQTLATNKAMARRNPELGQQALLIKPPLRDALKIPIELGYCPDASDPERFNSTDFLNYQRFILGLPSQPAYDACFSVDDEARFVSDLEAVLNRKLADARSQNPQQLDMFFNVAINHRLRASFQTFQNDIAKALATRISAERGLISPRLVGAFVYDSQPAQADVLAKSSQIIWCPRVENREETPETIKEANCVPRKGGDFNLGPLNFIIPMGPFPTMDKYLWYLQSYDDRGKTKNPKFSVRAVKTSASSVTDPNADQLYTFFDGERLSVQKSEHLRFCRERDKDRTLSQLIFRKPQGDILDLDHAQDILDSGETDTVAPNLYVGLKWNAPFTGAFTFDVPIEGKVLNVIPLSTSISQNQKLGDVVWTKNKFDLTPLLQKCRRFCHHPYFDEAGVYQISRSWNAASTCPTAKIAEPPR